MTLVAESFEGYLLVRMRWTAQRPGFDADLFEEFASLLRNASERADIAAIILTGSDRCFCYGSDVTSFSEQQNLDALSRASRALFSALAEIDVPLIAAVNGTAMGVGFSMLLHFDVVLASPSADFRAPFAQWGLSPEAGASSLLPSLMGTRRAFQMFCLGGALSAKQAMDCGIVSSIVDAEELEKEAHTVARRLIRLPRKALRKTRRLLHSEQQLTERFETETELFKELLGEPDTAMKLFALARATSVVIRRATG